MSKYTRNIGVKTEIYEKLEEKKSPGQSFTGVIKELINQAEKYEKIKSCAELERQEQLEKILEESCKAKIKINSIENNH